MEKLYIVCWGSGSCDDHGNAHAYTGVHGIYRDKKSALKGLVECKDEMFAEIIEDLDPDGEYPECVDDADIKLYGSEVDEFFEIDYTIGIDPCEVHIRIEEKEFN